MDIYVLTQQKITGLKTFILQLTKIQVHRVVFHQKKLDYFRKNL